MAPIRKSKFNRKSLLRAVKLSKDGDGPVPPLPPPGSHLQELERGSWKRTQVRVRRGRGGQGWARVPTSSHDAHRDTDTLKCCCRNRSQGI